MSSDCIFELDRSPAKYFCGETISGTITLNNSEDKNVRDVSITFLGEGYVKWNETQDYTQDNTRTITMYRSHEVYINNSTLVRGNGILPAGKHTWSINILLPEDCPSSLEGKYGYKRYELILKINRYYRFDNIYKKSIIIVKPIDLNLYSSYKIPVSAELIKNVCCWPCQSGNILITLIIPFGAYTVGQLIPYSLHIQNHSMSDINGYNIEFSKEITFTAYSPTVKQRFTKDILKRGTSLEKCLKLSNRVIEGGMYIPDTPCSTNEFDIIFVKYNLKIILKLSGCSRNPKLSVPIIIGTIPIRESLTNAQIVVTNRTQQQLLSQVATDIIAEAQNVNDSTLPNYNDLNPIACEESNNSDTSLSDTENETKKLIV